MASSTRVEPLCTGRCTWSQRVGTASMASTMSRPKSRGCEVVKRTRRMPGNFAHRRQQFGESLLPCRIFVGIHVLAEQLNFGVAEIGHLPGFRQDGIRSPAALLAAGEGNHAVGAELVAAFDDGDVAAVRVGAGGEFGFEAFVGLAVVEPGDARFPASSCTSICGRLRYDASRKPAKHAARARKSSRLPAAPRSPARRTSCPAFCSFL